MQFQKTLTLPTSAASTSGEDWIFTVDEASCYLTYLHSIDVVVCLVPFHQKHFKCNVSYIVQKISIRRKKKVDDFFEDTNDVFVIR